MGELKLEKLVRVGQIQEGDKLLLVTKEGLIKFETAKKILYPNTGEEEIIYRKKKNYYFITIHKIGSELEGYVRSVYRVLFEEGE